MHRKRNGFTLIELLLVIALVLSLLGIAIFNVTKLTKKQKENSFETVKEQVVTAAEQYFSSNEYLFEGIEKGGSGTISVEELVGLDYLNKLTNPVTGKALNKCDKVIVTRKDNGSFDYKFESSEDDNCHYVVSEFRSTPDAPEVKVYFAKGDDVSGNQLDGTNGQPVDNWYNAKELDGEKLNVIIETTGRIFKGVCKGVCPIDGSYTIPSYVELTIGYRDTQTYSNDKEITKYTYKVCNGESDKSCAKVTIMGGKDEELPSCAASLSPSVPANGWYKNTDNPKLTFTSTDLISGFSDGKNNSTISKSIDVGEHTYTGKFKDVAGNESDCDQLVRLDDADPTCPKTLLTYKEVTSGKNSYCDPSKSKDGWHCTDVVATLTKGANWVKYKWDGKETTKTTKTYSASGTHTPTITAYDSRGDSITCTASTLKIDKDKPSCTPSLSPSVPASGWYNSKPTLTFTGTDSLSGINGNKTFKPSVATGENTYSKEFIDKAGNKNSCSQLVKYDVADPTCPTTLLTYSNITTNKNSYCDPSKSIDGWHCTDVLATLTKGENWVKYKWDGVETTEITKKYSSTSTPTITAYNSNGESITCTASKLNIDKTRPSVTVTLPDISNASKWYNTSIKYRAAFNDTGSGIGSMNSYWNKSGLTTSQADSSEYSWNSSNVEYKGGNYNTISVTKGKLDFPNENYLSSQGHRKIRYIACDRAGNCNTDAKSAKIDTTPPVITNVQKPVHSTSYCGGTKAIYTSFDVNDKFSGVDRVDHFMDNKTSTTWYKNYKYSNIASTLSSTPKKSEIGSLISVYNGKSTKDVSPFEYSYFSTSDGKLGVRTKNSESNGPGFNINRAWSYDSLSAARTKGCGTISNSSKTPGSSVSTYCNYVAVKDAAGNKASAKICNDGTNVRGNNN